MLLDDQLDDQLDGVPLVRMLLRNCQHLPEPASGLRMYLKRIEAQTKSLEDNKAGVIFHALWILWT